MTAERSGGVPRQSNPFDGELAHANSSRAVLRGRKLVRAPRGKPTAPLQEFAHDSFRALVLNPTSPAWGQSRRSGAEAATSTSTRRWARRGRPRSSRDLFDFVGEQENLSGEFSCFVACFEAPAGFDEEAFEGLLWEQLQRLHEQDRRHHSWDPAVSPDPEDPTFAFSFAGTAFFVGLHAASSRSARRFAWPTLVFNAHHQFDRLRKESRYDRFQEIIRDRERDLQGILTPNLADFGTRSEARQYFGRPVQGDGAAPSKGSRRTIRIKTGDLRQREGGLMEATARYHL